MTSSLFEIKNATDAAKDILLVAHIQPDGDTLGSCFALKNMFERMGKHAQVCCEGDIPHRYSDLFAGQTYIQPHKIDKDYDLAIAVDCADKARLGKSLKAFKRAKTTMNIDHHITNDCFAEINYIAKASSVGEIVCEIMRFFEIEQDKQSAEFLYIAISTDTGNFTYSNTSKKCLSCTAELVELFDLRRTADILFRRRTLVSTKLIARALSRLQTYEEGKIAFVTITDSDLKEIGAKGGDCENIVDFAREIDETKVAVFFRELNNSVKISLRSKGDIDVCAIATVYGGGGHANAAGCSVKGKLSEVQESLLNRLLEIV